MHTSPIVLPCDGAIPGPYEASARPARDLTEATLLLQDHGRIAKGMNDIVVRRLFSAALDLEATLGLVGEHHAAGKIQHAIDELDLAIRDLRDTLFDHRPMIRPPGRARAPVRPAG